MVEGKVVVAVVTEEKVKGEEKVVRKEVTVVVEEMEGRRMQVRYERTICPYKVHPNPANWNLLMYSEVQI